MVWAIGLFISDRRGANARCSGVMSLFPTPFLLPFSWECVEIKVGWTFTSYLGWSLTRREKTFMMVVNSHVGVVQLND